MRILFIGNSHTYVNDLPLLVKEAAKKDGIGCEVRMITHGGWFLSQHVNEPDVHFEILSDNYDYVVLQEHSHPFAPEQQYRDAAASLCELISKTHATPVIYATWAQKSEPELQEYMDGVNESIAFDTGALLAPVGHYWQEYIAAHPDVEMYGPDGQHAAVYGSRFAARIIWACIYGDIEERRMDECKELINAIVDKSETTEKLVVTLDGPCASGKTMLASQLAEYIGAYVVHTDDFVIPHAAKTGSRLMVPGGNCDSTRLINEVLKPFKNGENVSYRRYICKEDKLGDAESLPETGILILEGSYCNLPEIRAYADVRSFVNTADSVRYERLEKRENAESLERYKKRWIPLEEAYFSAYNLPDKNCIVINGGK